MRALLRLVFVLVTVAAAIAVPVVAQAASPCPVAACITIAGTAIGPMGEAVPNYNVSFQRNDGFSQVVTTGADGRYYATLPTPAPNQCYQIAGQSDAFYGNSNPGGRFCISATVNLTPKIRSNSFGSAQKVYYPDASVEMRIPIEVQALSRTNPAPFDGQPMPWNKEHHDPLAPHHHENGLNEAHDHNAHHGEPGVFDPPTITKIADGVYKYAWKITLTLPAGQYGHYDFDWGRAGSVYDPMMECRMIWFGYGLEQMSPAKAVPGQTITLTGRRFGTQSGRVMLKGAGLSAIEGSSIVSWSDTSVTVVIPVTAKTGYISVEPASRIPTNALYLSLDPVKFAL